MNSTYGGHGLLIRGDECLYGWQGEGYLGRLLVAARGKEQGLEVVDFTYEAGMTTPYHLHRESYETIFVLSGQVEVTMMGKKAVAKAGDLLHFEPHMPHRLRFLSDSRCRFLLQGRSVAERDREKKRLAGYYANKLQDEDFVAQFNARHDIYLLPYDEAREAPEGAVSQLRASGAATCEFAYEGMDCRLKVGRWETGTHGELWEFVLPEGAGKEWREPLAEGNVFVVAEGQVGFWAGEEHLVVEAGDIICAPKYMPHGIKAVSATARIFGYLPHTLLLRLLEDQA